MTGIGTQNDPYIPTTLTEFITAVGTSGAYVALTQDINAADDPGYSGELTTYTPWRCADVEGGNFALSGITVRGSSIFSAFRAVNVKNLRFRDLAYAGTTGNNTVFSHDAGSGKYFAMTNCLVSIKASSSGYHPVIAVDAYFTRCAFDLSYSGTGGRDDRLFDNCELRETITHISGYTAPALSLMIRCPGMVRSAFVLDNCDVSATIAASPRGTQQYSYAAVRQSVAGHSITAESSGAGCVLATDGSISANLASGWTQATIEQMKDKDWLTSVGFLP